MDSVVSGERFFGHIRDSTPPPPPFFNFLQPQKNKIQCKYSMWLSPEMRESPPVWMMRLGMDLVVSDVNSNFEVFISNSVYIHIYKCWFS